MFLFLFFSFWKAALRAVRKEQSELKSLRTGKDCISAREKHLTLRLQSHSSLLLLIFGTSGAQKESMDHCYTFKRLNAHEIVAMNFLWLTNFCCWIAHFSFLGRPRKAMNVVVREQSESVQTECTYECDCFLSKDFTESKIPTFVFVCGELVQIQKCKLYINWIYSSEFPLQEAENERLMRERASNPWWGKRRT